MREEKNARASTLPADSRVLVTGGSGFIGTNLVEFYSSRGFETRSLDMLEPRNAAQLSLWRAADLTDQEAMVSEIAEFAPTHLLHFGARTDLGGQTVNDYAANTVGVENVLAAVQATQSITRVVLASSMLVCKFGYLPSDELDVCPSTPYGESKVVGEQLVRENPPHVPWTIMRPTSIWGPWFGSPYRDFFAAVASGRYMHPGRRGALQTYGFVGNSVVAVDRVASSADATGMTLYLGDWPALNLRDWADSVALASGRKKPRTAPLPLLRAAGKIGDGLERVKPGIAPLTSFRLANMTTDNKLDLSELEQITGSELPWTLEEGVQQTARWASEHPLQ